MNTFKKTTTMLLTLMVIIITSTTTFSKAGWTDCLWNDGKNGHTWYEAADGKVKKVTKTGWTADLTQIGWGGIWGAQMYRNINMNARKKYRLKFKIKSTGCNKWVFVKIGQGENYAYGQWLWLKKNKYKTVDVTFKSKIYADTITFGFGGEYGDRAEMDGTKHYAYAGGAQAIRSKRDAGGDSGPHDKTFTKIILKNYSLKKVKKKRPRKTYTCNCNCKYCK